MLFLLSIIVLEFSTTKGVSSQDYTLQSGGHFHLLMKV